MILAKIKTAPPGLLLAPPVREVEMEVVFGTPSKNCSGAGVCMIAGRFPEGYQIACPHAPAIIHFLPGNELVFRFRKKHLNPDLVRRYFSAKRFVVEEPFRLPAQLVEQWKLPVRTVPAGYYAAEEYTQEWRLYFNL